MGLTEIAEYKRRHIYLQSWSYSSASFQSCLHVQHEPQIWEHAEKATKRQHMSQMS